MASKDSTAALSPESNTTSLTAEENVTLPQASERGLASSTPSSPTKPVRKVEVVQKVQVSFQAKTDKSKDQPW